MDGLGQMHRLHDWAAHAKTCVICTSHRAEVLRLYDEKRESDLREVARRALQEDGDSLDASSAVAVVDRIVRDFLYERGGEK